MRPANRKLVTPFLRPLRSAVGAAAEAFGRLDARLAAAEAAVPPPEEDDKVLAVRQAREVALKSRDVELADRLAAVEKHLLGSDTRPQTESFFTPRSGKSTGDARVADIRSKLLENTARPDDDQA
ncbi:MAG: hypothetical protein GEV04_16040 [Actinophytocola sp.]|nr:hypothetical protein [Actinophytocola sp.]